MAVTLPAAVLRRYPRFSLYNSPYPAHDDGCAIDLYPESGAPSPVAGEVVATETVRAPPKPHAADHDHLVVVDTGDHLARVLHVDPAVEPGDEVAVGDPLGRMVRSGFFAPWVANHIHLGFRERDANPYRASGSLPLALDAAVDVRPLDWDGTGTVVERGDTYVVLDAPAHPEPGAYFAGIAGAGAGAGVAGSGGSVLDGGCPHYEGGGLLGGDGADGDASLLATPVGVAADRTVSWDDIVVRANGQPIRGVSLFASQVSFGTKLVCPGHEFAVGERIAIEIVHGVSG